MLTIGLFLFPPGFESFLFYLLAFPPMDLSRFFALFLHSSTTIILLRPARLDANATTTKVVCNRTPSASAVSLPQAMKSQLEMGSHVSQSRKLTENASERR